MKTFLDSDIIPRGNEDPDILPKKETPQPTKEKGPLND